MLKINIGPSSKLIRSYSFFTGSIVSSIHLL